MLSKEDQLKKNKKPNLKKLSPIELQLFEEFIFEKSGGLCQLCKTEPLNTYHHSRFGNMGACKDDRSLIAICQADHHEIHHGNKGIGRALRNLAIIIGDENWDDYNGSLI